MNKTAIKNFAIWARNKLIADISYRAGLMGITAGGIQNALPQSAGTTEFYDIGTSEPYAISGDAVKQRRHLVDLIRAKEKETNYKTAYKYVLEEVAYTWFNRLIAVRFMEVNDYLPSHIRVLSSDSGKMEPDLVTTPFDTDLSFTREEEKTIYQLKQENKIDELFRMLFIKQCNALNELLPALFEKTSDYTELLLNLSVIDQDGVVYHLVHDIPEEDFNVERGGQVEIIGWLYQYYNTEPKNEAFAKKGKITKEEVPAVTQLFTPDWIVRYMVENSLGRLWVEGHPNDRLKAGWKYYLEEAEQEPEVQAKLVEIRAEYAKLNPEDIKVIDPCMGSGHILVYAFDVLIQIYESAGYSQRDAARSILENNLYGLDIDDRAFQMAYFAVMMKARQYNRRILNSDCRPNVYSIQESNEINRDQFQYFGAGLNEFEKNNAITQMNGLLDTFRDAKEYGSILTVDQYDWDLLDRFVSNIETIGQMSMYTVGLEDTTEDLKQMIAQGKVLAQKYQVATTNPPYMGAGGMGAKLTSFLQVNYPAVKSDLFSVVIQKMSRIVTAHGLFSYIAPQSIMFLSTQAALRRELLSATTLISLLDLGVKAFDSGFGTATAVFAKGWPKGTSALCMNLTETDDKEAVFSTRKAPIYFSSTDTFEMLPGEIFSYACTKRYGQWFQRDRISTTAALDCGIKTGSNNTFVRLWYEVSLLKTAYSGSSLADMENGTYKWFKYSQGGGYHRWYGAIENVVDLERGAERIKKTISKATYRLRDKRKYFLQGMVWPMVGTNNFSCRLLPYDVLPDIASNVLYCSGDYQWDLLAYMNSKVFNKFMIMVNPTVNYPIDSVGAIPYCHPDASQKNIIEEICKGSVELCKNDWDAFETSWDFKEHPFITVARWTARNGEAITVKQAFADWERVADDRFLTLKKNEEELNRIFIDIYGLSDELTPEVEDKNVTVRRADLQRDIRSLLSYAVGCMFGRYSLDIDGLAYAGGKWDEGKYGRFKPDADNIIPISDEEYLEDDVLSRLCTFLKVAFGEDTLEENLDYVAKALGNKGDSSREVIRNYFLNDFFKDHCQTYSATGSGKRPIYWLFDSGKQNGFKALIYLHRYNADTIGNLRVDYLHRMQRIYENEISRMQDMIDHSTNAREVAQATKRREKLTKQLKECREYDEKLAHLALSRIELDLDDGVKINYRKIQTANDGKFYEVLADSKNIMAKE